MSTLSPQAASSLTTSGVVEHAHPSIVDWAAIIAGGLLATAISFILITFGSAIGLSLTSPYEGSGFSAVFLAVAVGLWVVWVQISSFIAGAYLAGRLRRRLPDATAHEVEVRDGSHGLLVWALGVVIGACLRPRSPAAQRGQVLQLSRPQPKPLVPVRRRLLPAVATLSSTRSTRCSGQIIRKPWRTLQQAARKRPAFLPQAWRRARYRPMTRRIWPG